MYWSEEILNLFGHLHIEAKLPADVDVLNPYEDSTIFLLCEQFYRKYYHDEKQRSLIIGINPGRLGGGLTGIPFTDPNKLQEFCGINNSLKKQSELSADFIWKVVMSLGGPKFFYQQFYFSSVSPLGFTMNGKNLNYYDIPELQSALKSFIIDCLKKQLKFGLHREVCFVLGEGKNYKCLDTLNREFKFFEKLVPLPHPRFIMQYRRKKLPEYMALYCKALTSIRLIAPT